MKLSALSLILAATAMLGQTPTTTPNPNRRINWNLACNRHLPRIEQPWVAVDSFGCASWDEAKYPTHPKEWNPAMCSKVGHFVGDVYINYCIRMAPEAKPVCPAPETVRNTSTHGPSYFEPLDCSWHTGTDPRLEK